MSLKSKTGIPVAPQIDLNVIQTLKHKKPVHMDRITHKHARFHPFPTYLKSRNRMVKMQFAPNSNWRWRKQLMPDRIVYVYIVTRLRLFFPPCAAFVCCLMYDEIHHWLYPILSIIQPGITLLQNPIKNSGHKTALTMCLIMKKDLSRTQRDSWLSNSTGIFGDCPNSKPLNCLRK